jgi:hypothetical protein
MFWMILLAHVSSPTVPMPINNNRFDTEAACVAEAARLQPHWGTFKLRCSPSEGTTPPQPTPTPLR